MSQKFPPIYSGQFAIIIIKPCNFRWCSWTLQCSVRSHSSQGMRTYNVQVSLLVFPQSVQKCNITPRPPALPRSNGEMRTDRNHSTTVGRKAVAGAVPVHANRRGGGAGGHQAGDVMSYRSHRTRKRRWTRRNDFQQQKRDFTQKGRGKWNKRIRRETDEQIHLQSRLGEFSL